MGRRARLPDTDPVETGEWLEALRDVAGKAEHHEQGYCSMKFLAKPMISEFLFRQFLGLHT